MFYGPDQTDSRRLSPSVMNKINIPVFCSKAFACMVRARVRATSTFCQSRRNFVGRPTRPPKTSLVKYIGTEQK